MAALATIYKSLDFEDDSLIFIHSLLKCLLLFQPFQSLTLYLVVATITN